MTIVPLRAILWQILFLTIAIAIESFVLHQKLYLSRRISIEYAASLNLFSTIFGWATFFLFNSLLPVGLQQQMINFILFGNFAPHLQFSLIRIFFDLVAFILFTFLLIFSVERIGLDFSIAFSKLNINSPSKQEDSDDADLPDPTNQKYPKALEYSLKRTKSNTILLANVCSQSLILLILVILEKF